MSIFIHHGAPGSYKTSGALWLRLLPAITSGRHIITNVRGLNLERMAKYLKMDVSDISIEFIDTDHPDGRLTMARFWHWARKDAFLFIDECGRIWPPRLTVTNLKALDTPPDLVAEDRPESFEVAFDMHRHHGWDICLTTPNIAKVHNMIREAAEIGYRHFNRATVGLGAKFTLTTHDAANSGQMDSHALTRQVKKIPSPIFKMYASTTTGKARDTMAGTALWKDRKILFLFGMVFLMFSYSFYGLHDNPIFTGGNDATIESEQSEPQSKATVGNAVGSKAVAPASFGFCIGRLCVQDGFVTVGDERYRLVDNLDIPYRGLWATGHHIYKDTLTVFFETESGSVPTELFASSYRYKVLPLPDFNHFVVFDTFAAQALWVEVKRGLPIKTENDKKGLNSIF